MRDSRNIKRKQKCFLSGKSINYLLNDRILFLTLSYTDTANPRQDLFHLSPWQSHQLSTVAPRYNAVVGVHEMEPCYKRGAL